MRYDEVVSIVNRNVDAIRRHLKNAADSEDVEVQTAEVKKARIVAGRLYTEMGNDLKALKGGSDPISAREERAREKAARKTAREARKAERDAAKEAATV